MQNCCIELDCELTPAERMLNVAERFNRMPNTSIIRTNDDMTGVQLTVNALKFAKLPPVLIFRAIVESYTYDAITRLIH